MENFALSPVNKAPKILRSAKAMVEQIHCGVLDADEVIDATRNLIVEGDGDIRAWKTLDWDQVEEQYKELSLIHI